MRANDRVVEAVSLAVSFDVPRDDYRVPWWWKWRTRLPTAIETKKTFVARKRRLVVAVFLLGRRWW